MAGRNHLMLHGMGLGNSLSAPRIGYPDPGLQNHRHRGLGSLPRGFQYNPSLSIYGNHSTQICDECFERQIYMESGRSQCYDPLDCDNPHCSQFDVSWSDPGYGGYMGRRDSYSHRGGSGWFGGGGGGRGSGGSFSNRQGGGLFSRMQKNLGLGYGGRYGNF